MSKYYIFKDETIIGLADEVRRLGKREGGLTSAEMKEILAGITPGSVTQMFNSKANGFVVKMPEGIIIDTLDLSNLKYTINAIGTLPVIQEGISTDTINLSNLNYIINATGILPTIYSGISTDTLTMNNITFNSSAIGVLQ